MANGIGWLCVLLVAQSFAQPRPRVETRSFRSVAVDLFVDGMSKRLADRRVAKMFTRSFPNTLDTTVRFNVSGKAATFVITGDIDAMWLRDSANQVLPYMHFVKNETKLDAMIQGLIQEHTRLVLLDPYANAFNRNPSQFAGHMHDDTTKMVSNKSRKPVRVHAMNKYIFERKFEIDSLCAFLKLANAYYKATGSVLDGPFNDRFISAVELVYNVFKIRQGPQQHEYTFARKTTVPTDTLLDGVGAPFRVTGMLSSPFRPSDDATTFPFLIPANAMAVVELRRMADLMRALEEEVLAGIMIIDFSHKSRNSGLTLSL